MSPDGRWLVGEVFTRPVPNAYEDFPAVWSRQTSGQWSIELLPVPPSAFGAALDANNAGQIVGIVAVPTTSPPQIGFYSLRAATWSRQGGSAWEIELLPSDPAGEAGAAAVNASGVIAGNAGDRAVVWTRSAAGWNMQDLGTLGGTDFSFASGVNDLGEVVGATFDAAGRQRAFVWRSGEGLRDLGSLAAEASAYAINASGAIVGLSYNQGDGAVIGTFWPGR